MDSLNLPKVCSREACRKETFAQSPRCPSCKELGLVHGSMYCSQECLDMDCDQHMPSHYYFREGPGNLAFPMRIPDSLWIPGCKPYSFHTSGAKNFRLVTDRLILRPVVPADFSSIHAVKSHPEVNTYQLYDRPQDLEDTNFCFSMVYIVRTIPWLRDYFLMSIMSMGGSADKELTNAFNQDKWNEGVGNARRMKGPPIRWKWNWGIESRWAGDTDGNGEAGTKGKGKERMLRPRTEQEIGIRGIGKRAWRGGESDRSGYIGHVSLDLQPPSKTFYSPQPTCEYASYLAVHGLAPPPPPDPSPTLDDDPSHSIYYWPSPSKLTKITARIYYELHPSYWRQGIMTEAVREVVRYCFEEVGVGRVIIDPMGTNEGSLGVVSKLIPGMKKGVDIHKVGVNSKGNVNGNKDSDVDTGQGKKIRGGMKEVGQIKCWKSEPRGRGGKEIIQRVFAITRQDWLEAFGRDKDEQSKCEGKKVCRYCVNPRSEAYLPCKFGCYWALYCSEECRLAHWKILNGHQIECHNSKYAPSPPM